MKDGLYGGAALVAAYLLFCLLRPLSGTLDPVVDVFTAAVLLFGAFRGEIPGAVFGAVCGLLVDAFSLGVFGLAGLSLTAGGYLAGTISRKINIQAFFRSLLFFLILSAGTFAAWTGLVALIGRSPMPWAGGWILARPAVTAVAAALLYDFVRRLKTRHDR
ncbi:MAG: hypothetical protein JW843_11960 [Candidatus Aminicenantes bacterium]|nr:hypothetical protein [Candidatus Aminicenantes bacterium]